MHLVIISDHHCIAGGTGGNGGKGQDTGGAGGKGGSFTLIMAIQTQCEFVDVQGKSQLDP